MGPNQAIEMQIDFCVVFVTTMNHNGNLRHRMGSYRVDSPPIGSNRGLNQSHGPPLSTGSTGAAVAIDYPIRYCR